MKKVEIYTTPTCTYCNQAKQFFAEHGIEYTAYDVSIDAEKRAEMIAKTKQMGVPVIVIDGTDIIIGFNKKLLEETLLGEGQPAMAA